MVHEIELSQTELDAIKDGRTISRELDGTIVQFTNENVHDKDGNFCRITNWTFDRLHAGQLPRWERVLDEPIEVSLEHPPVAERAAEILRDNHERASFEASDSDESDEQYVDVHANPHEQSSEVFGLRNDDMSDLREAGLHVRSLSSGRERSRFNSEHMRIWFESVDR